MKKIFALILALTMLVSLVACATKPATVPSTPDTSTETPPKDNTPATEDPATDTEREEPAALPFDGVTLSLWMPPYTGEDQSYWNGRMEEFKETTGCTVETTIVPWGDMSTKYMAGFMSGEGPDVFYMTNELMYDMVNAGSCLELSPYFTQEEVDDQLYWSAGYQLGGQYAAPFASGVSFRGVAFNLDILKTAGVTEIPQTWDELIDAAKAVKDKNLCEYPVMYPMATGNANLLISFFPTLWSAGADLVNADATQVTFDTPEALSAMQYLYDLCYTHQVLSTDCTGIEAISGIDLFKEGKIAISFTEPGYLMDQEIDFEWTATLGVTDGQHNLYTFSPMDTISVNAASKHVDAAIALLKFLISEGQRNNFRETNYPTLAKLNASAEPIVYKEAFINDAMAKLGEHSKTMPVCKGVSTMTEVISTNLQLMMMDELTPEKALETMQAACTTELNG